MGASAPKEDFTLFIDDFAQLAAKTKNLVEILKQCNSVKCVPNESVMDLVLMVDTSSSVGQANFVLIKDFLANIFGNLVRWSVRRKQPSCRQQKHQQQLQSVNKYLINIYKSCNIFFYISLFVIKIRIN